MVSLAVSTARMLRKNQLLDAWLMVAVKNFAFYLSMLSFAAGICVFGWYQTASITNQIQLYVTLGFFCLMGGGASLVCESLTVTNCKKLTHTLDMYLATVERQSKVADTSNSVRLKKRNQMKTVRSNVRSFAVAILLTSIISFIGGMLFWHWVLSGTAPIVSWLASSAFSLLVSIALVYSTLSEKTTKVVVEQSLKAADYIQEATQSDLRVQMSEAYGKSMQRVLIDEMDNGDDMRELARDQFHNLADKTLGGNGTISKYLAETSQRRRENETAALAELDNLYVETPSGLLIPDKASRGDKARNITKIKKLLKEKGWEYVQDKVTDESLAAELGVSSGSVYRYMQEIKAEQVL